MNKFRIKKETKYNSLNEVIEIRYKIQVKEYIIPYIWWVWSDIGRYDESFFICDYFNDLEKAREALTNEIKNYVYKTK